MGGGRSGRGAGNRAIRLKFRDATEADAPAIAGLLNAAAGGLTALHGAGRWSWLVTERDVKPGDANMRLRIGRHDRQILTVLRLATKKPWAIDPAFFTQVDRPLYLTDMAVAVAAWKQGLGRQALDDARRIAEEWPADAIRLDAWDAEAGAGGFYARCGYERRGRTLYRGNALEYYELLLP